MNQAANNFRGKVVDALQAMSLHTAEAVRCPLCDRWVKDTESQWNPYKGCCTDCAELDG
jgi:hypothetical protein